MALTNDPDEARKSGIDPETGMQKMYAVLSEEERSKGFIRPVRTRYVHLTCGTVTSMALEIAETYARDPHFYGGTFCVHCRNHFPVGPDGEFVWAKPREGTPLGQTDKVGS